MSNMVWQIVNLIVAANALIEVGKILRKKVFPEYLSIFNAKSACDKAAELLVNLIVGVDFFCLSVVLLIIIKFV